MNVIRTDTLEFALISLKTRHQEMTDQPAKDAAAGIHAADPDDLILHDMWLCESEAAINDLQLAFDERVRQEQAAGLR